MTSGISSNKPRILLVNDNIRILHSIHECLFRAGFMNILVAFDYGAAVQIAENEKPNLVILDKHLADTANLEALERIRREGDGRSMHLIFTYKARLDSTALNRIFKNSSIDFLRVPFSNDNLLDLVQAALDFEKASDEMMSFPELREEAEVTKSVGRSGGGGPLDKKRNPNPYEDRYVIENLQRSGRSGYMDNVYNDLKIKNNHLQDELLYLTLKLSHLNDFILDLKRILTCLTDDIPLENSKCREEVAEALQLVSRYLKNGYWKEFKLRFAEVHPDFYDQLLLHSPSLTESDLRLCALIKMKLSSKEIATIINHTVNSVKVARNRLRAKLTGIRREETLMNFMVKY